MIIIIKLTTAKVAEAAANETGQGVHEFTLH